MSWKKINSQIVFENDWMTVRDDQVINPGGGENQYGHVHFKNKAVAIVPLDDDMNTWLVGQDRYTVNTFTWEIPMGGAPLAEDPLIAANRELKEETGLRASRWSRVMNLHTSNSITDEEAIVYVAQGLTQGEPEFEETENIEIRKLSLTDALNMVFRGEITDAISCAALLRVSTLEHLSESLGSINHFGRDDVS
jgi:8-oxo-dGTP pyrophosphatase MutT (NUDIX family)